MKIKTIYHIAILLICFLTITSCTKDFDEINTDPNRITEASSGSLMVYAQREAAYLYLTGGSVLSQWGQYTANRTAANAFENFDPEGTYSGLYHNVLYQLDQIIVASKIEESNADRNYYAIANIMQIWTMAIGVELWGDLPYYDALQGGTYEGGTNPNYISPRFNTQQDVLKDLIVRLDEINNFMNESSGLSGLAAVGSYDIYANGNMGMWQKFANALQAKLLLNLNTADPQFSVDGLNKIFSAPELYPVFETNSDNLGIKWQGLGALPANISGVANALYNNGDYEGYTSTLSTGIIRILAERKDPRRFTFFQRPNTLHNSTFEPGGVDTIQIGNYIYHKDSINVMTGFPPARTEATPSNALRPSLNLYSTIGGGFANIYRTDFIMDYSEFCFIKAEAKLKGVSALSEDVNTYFENGIRANFGYFKKIHNQAIEDEMLFANTTFGMYPDDIYSEDSIVNYLSNSNVMLTGDLDGDMEKIITQRFISGFYNGYKAFTLIRRTGYPKLDYFAIGVNTDLGYPTRYKYPEVIAVTNGDNLIAAIGKLTNNIFDGKLWMFENSPVAEPAFDTPIEDYQIYDVFTCEKIYPAE